MRSSHTCAAVGRELGIACSQMQPPEELTQEQDRVMGSRLIADMMLRQVATIVLWGSWPELEAWAQIEFSRIGEFAVEFQGPFPPPPPPPAPPAPPPVQPLVTYIHAPVWLSGASPANPNPGLLPAGITPVPHDTVAGLVAPSSTPAPLSPPLSPHDSAAPTTSDIAGSPSATTSSPSSPPSAPTDMPRENLDIESGESKRKRERLSLESNETQDSIDPIDIPGPSPSTSAAAGPSKTTKKKLHKRARNAAGVTENVVVEATEAGEVVQTGEGADPDADADAEGDEVDGVEAVEANELAAGDVNAEAGNAEAAAAAAAAAAAE